MATTKKNAAGQCGLAGAGSHKASAPTYSPLYQRGAHRAGSERHAWQGQTKPPVPHWHPRAASQHQTASCSPSATLGWTGARTASQARGQQLSGGQSRSPHQQARAMSRTASQAASRATDPTGEGMAGLPRTAMSLRLAQGTTTQRPAVGRTQRARRRSKPGTGHKPR